MNRGLGVILAVMFAATIHTASANAQDARAVVRARRGDPCRGCNLFQADLARTTLRGVDLAHARLRQADLSAAVMTHAHLRDADLRDVEGFGVVLTGADLAHADLTHASFVGAYMQNANLSGARLVGVNLSGADLTGAHGLTPSSLARACGDASTRLPRGLTVASCR